MISPWVSKINERSNFGLMSPPVLLLLSKQIKGFPKGWNLENWCPSCPGGDNSQVWKQKSQKSKPRQLKYQTFQTSGNRNWYSVTLLLKRNLKQIKFSQKPEMVSMYPISGLSDLLLNTRRWSKTIIDYRLYRYHLYWHYNSIYPQYLVSSVMGSMPRPSPASASVLASPDISVSVMASSPLCPLVVWKGEGNPFHSSTSSLIII